MTSHTTATDVRTIVSTQIEDLKTIRHDLHAHPELMFQEKRTVGVVARELDALQVAYTSGLAGGTGLIAHIPATDQAPDRPAIALRADMDALPIAERTSKPYVSTNAGVMHACGHDGHTTILIGAARTLSRLPDRPNPVTLVFQPAEEGGAGGKVLCDEGVLLGERGGGIGPPVSRIFGLHGWPDLPLGHVATRPGPLLASTDDFEIIVRGRQAHAAYPHFGRDPILAAAHVVTAVQSIASRSIDPLDSIVVTVAEFHAGSANNIIPESVRLTGTIRTLGARARVAARERFIEIVERTASAMGCAAEIDYKEGYPVTNNDPSLVEHFFSVARPALGEDRVRVVEHPSMGGEDFSYYGQHVPACFFLLGLCPEGQDAYPKLHQPDFDFNDDAIALGVEMMCRLALAQQ